MNKKYYVVATDTFLSGWGESRGKTNKLVIPCLSYETAHKVYTSLKGRSDMKHVNIRNTKPYYNKETILISEKTPSDFLVSH